MPRASEFTFGSYSIDARRSCVTFRYTVTFVSGRVRTYSDKLFFPDIPASAWGSVPDAVLRPTLEALLLILGINYWCIYPTRNIRIDGFVLSREQAAFWDAVYLNGLAEFFYDMKMDFRGLIAFPFDATYVPPVPAELSLPKRSLLLNGAGKDSILSAEMLKASGSAFDFFSFAPTPAHRRVAALVGARTVRVYRRRDRRVNMVKEFFDISSAYPSVTTFTFIAALLAELGGYDRIVFSNERSADFGNLTYLGLEVNHQWCKSSDAERLTNEYIQRYLTPAISSVSFLRPFSELEIVRRFVRYPQYLPYVTSCNNYFWLPWPMQYLSSKGYWCKRCPKCVFLFACFAAFLPKRDVVAMFGADMFLDRRLLPLVRRILGVEGFKPLDCVGEPEEMILAMHLIHARGEYAGSPAMILFEELFPATYDFEALKRRVFADEREA